MPRKPDKPIARTKAYKTKVVAFKVEEELADFLNKLPNKSAFIRKAIAAQFSLACPLCNGAGMVSRGIHDHYAPLLKQFKSRHCDGCGDVLPVPSDAGELTPDERERLEQFFHGGPLYCNGCYDTAPACHDCGWHITASQAEQHHRQAHTADE